MAQAGVAQAGVAQAGMVKESNRAREGRRLIVVELCAATVSLMLALRWCGTNRISVSYAVCHAGRSQSAEFCATTRALRRPAPAPPPYRSVSCLAPSTPVAPTTAQPDSPPALTVHATGAAAHVPTWGWGACRPGACVGAAGVDDLIHAWFREERMVQTKQARACLSVPGRALRPVWPYCAG